MNRERALMRSLYIRTLRRHVGPLLAYRVTNAANNNGRCPETGCHYAAGTACTAFMCPGRKLHHRASSNPRVCMGGEVPPLPASPPTSVFVPIHEVAYTHDGSRDHGA